MSGLFAGELRAQPTADLQHRGDAAPRNDAPKSKSDVTELGAVSVLGRPAIAETGSATGLVLTLKETPQSITVIDRVRIEDFALNNTAQLLDQVVGMNVERGESDRTTFTARGFDVSNSQLDGIAVPIAYGIQQGEVDTFLYDRVEVIRGANGLMSGVGNPAATINYVRKRPTADRRFQLGTHIGSFDSKRVEADASLPLGERSGWGLRVVGAHEQRDSHMINYDLKRDLFGAIVAGPITSNVKAAAGYTQQKNVTNGSGWGSVTHHYADGTPINHDRSMNFAPDWARWPVKDEQAFGELEVALGDWALKSVVTYDHSVRSPKLLYVSGHPDRETGLGMAASPASFRNENERYGVDLMAAGTVELFGRRHQLTFGVAHTEADRSEWRADATDAVVFPDFRTLSRVQPNEPGFGPLQRMLAEDEALSRVYVASQIDVADPFKIVTGISYAKFKVSGVNYGSDVYRENSDFNPYLGLLFDLTREVTLYASYTSIFNPQSAVDINRNRLDPVEGTNVEAGIKSELFGERLYASAAVFRTKQAGLAEFAGNIIEPDFYSYYVPVDTMSKGFEVELAGKVTDLWGLSGGYTDLKISNDDGNPTRTYQPRKSLKLGTTYRFPSVNNLTIGAQYRWQDDTYDTIVTGPVDASGNPLEFRQKAYGVLDLMAGINITPAIRATLNLRNVTDKKYLYSMVYAAYDQGFYAPGRNLTFSLNMRF